MKKIVLTATTLLITLCSYSQEGTDTTRIQLGDTRVIVINDDDSTEFEFDDESDDRLQLTHFAGVDVGVNFLLDANNSTDFEKEYPWLELDGITSMSWRFNLLEEKIRLIHDYVGIVVGGSLVYNSYGLKNDYTIVSNTTVGVDTTYAIQDTVLEFSKNKFRTASIQVPLMLEFNTSRDPEKTFHIAAGVVGGWRYGVITKQHYEYQGDKVERRVKEDFNVIPITLDATARIGYRNFTIFGTYGLTALFEEGTGPEVYPVTVGISLVPF